jgi:hypothetical protein
MITSLHHDPISREYFAVIRFTDLEIYNVREILPHQVEPKTPEELARLLTYILDHKDERKIKHEITFEGHEPIHKRRC